MKAAVALVLAVALLVALGPVASAQGFRYQRVEFSEPLSARVQSGIGLDNLPQTVEGVAVDEPAVLVTATAQGVFVRAGLVLALEGGRVRAADLRLCSAKVPCAPGLRDAIASARARLAVAVADPSPKVLILVHARVPYETLLVVARSAAEAGAALSLRLIARTRDGGLLGLPVWVAPGRPLAFGRSQSPALVTVDVGPKAVSVRASRFYMKQPEWAANLADLQQKLGHLQLYSGRTTYFITAAEGTSSGAVVNAIASAREVFPNTVLMDRGGMRVVGH